MYIATDAFLGLVLLLSLVFPHIAEVVALGDGHDHGHGPPSFQDHPHQS
jgi:hypothetical protein